MRLSRVTDVIDLGDSSDALRGSPDILNIFIKFSWWNFIDVLA